MSTKIEWTDETWNPIVGCSRVSPGCDHCYAIGVAHRGLSKQHRGLTIRRPGERTDWTGQVRFVESALMKPIAWRKPRKVFVNSMSDLFHPGVTDAEIDRIFSVMARTPQHTYQILTKRPQRMADLLTDWGGTPLPNVWLGTSIESDRYAWRADHLRRTPSAVRIVSAEPLLGPLPSLDLDGIDWLIVGGESGAGARPMHPDWVRDLRDRSEPTPTAFFFKQWGNWAPDPNYGTTFSLYDEAEVGTLLPFVQTGPGVIRRVEPERAEFFAAVTDTGHSRRISRQGKGAAGRVLDGCTWDEYPSTITTSADSS